MKTNSTIRRCLILGVILILSIPIILNLILGLPSPCCVTVIGESTDWLLFWGSYLGGIITAAIGFLSIFISQRNSSEMHEAERQKELEKYRENQAKRLQDELILRIESLNFCSISRILPRFPSSVSREEVIKEIERLKERSEKAELQGIDWGLMSWHELPSKPKDFDGFYVAIVR